MPVVKREGVVLRATDLYFENVGVMNPGVYQDGNTVHLFYRGMRSGGRSVIAYCKLDGPLTVSYRATEPLIVPEFLYEAHGVEDARIVKIDNTWYLTYTAWDGRFARGALAISTDLFLFSKKGPLFPRWTYEEFYAYAGRANVSDRYFSSEFTADLPLWFKNVVFFPRRINGKLFFLHRIRPGILIAGIDELHLLGEDFWKAYVGEMSLHILLSPEYVHESHLLGAGCPPIETAAGWLLIYHSIGETEGSYYYFACAALLDLDDPRKVIGRLTYPLLSAEEPWERYGNMSDVVFPTGAALFGDKLYIYYGAGDSCVGAFSVDINELLDELTQV